MNYVVTRPTKGRTTLHQGGCRSIHHRARRTDIIVYSNPVGVFNLRDLDHCGICIGPHQYAEARAETWRSHLIAAQKELAARRTANERHQRQLAAREAFCAQFESLRSACQIAWGRGIDRIDAYGQGNIAFRLRHDDWYDVGSINLQADDGASAVQVAGMNFSTALIGSARDAHALSALFTIIENWRSAQPLDVPADAPNFWRL